MPKPRIAVDTRITRRLSVGMQRYTRALEACLPAAAPDIDFTFFTQGGNINIVEQLVIPWETLVTRQRAVHFSTSFASAVMPRPYIVTVHDLIFMRYPELLPPATRRYFAWFSRWVVPRAARVIVDDERTILDLKRFLGVAPERCRIVPLGYDSAILAAQPYAAPSGREYFLYSGNRSPHKNVETLIEAWRRLPGDVAVDLYLTGPGHDAQDPSSGSGRALRYLGNVEERELWALYRGALAYVHPALVEGFGLPMLEAMALGTAVIAAEECVPLVLRENSTTFPAHDVAALTEILTDAGRNPDAFREQARRAATHARRFTWEYCAESTAAVYRELL